MPTTDQQGRTGAFFLILATVVHGVSYFMPMSWQGNETWGEIFCLGFLPALLEWNEWRGGWYILLAVLVPILVLLYTGIRFILNSEKLPRLVTLVVGLLLPSVIMPIMTVYLTFSRDIALGYPIWGLSFWLYFIGFWRYKRKKRPIVNDLSEHLVDNE